MNRTRIAFACVALLASTGALHSDDWPMFGGNPGRNAVSSEKGLPLEWDFKAKKHIKWVARLGDQTYGTPVVSGGRVFIGTNNDVPRNPEIKKDRGVLMCFSEKDGGFLWQAIHEKLPGGNAVEWPHVGVCSTPCVAGDRVYYVSNRNELVCADAEGFADGENDGPFKDETLKGKQDADFVWILDMREDLGALQNQAVASSPLVVGDLVFVVTGHGADHETREVHNPEAPSFVAVNRKTGKVVWQDNSPGDRILWGQWGSPAYGVVDGQPQVVFPGGDGWLYSFVPETGKLLWKFNCKAHEPPRKKPKLSPENTLQPTPVFAGHRVLVALGNEPDYMDDDGCVRAIDARKRGDITKTGELWRLAKPDFGTTLATMAVHDGLVYAIEAAGFLNCIDLETGKRVWRHDFLAAIYSSPLVADGKVYVRDEYADITIFQAGREKKKIALIKETGRGQGTPVAANGVLYLAGSHEIVAVAKED